MAAAVAPVVAAAVAVVIVAVANLVAAAAVRNAVGNPDNEQGDYALCRPVGELHGSAITRPVVIISVPPSVCLSPSPSVCLSVSLCCPGEQRNNKSSRVARSNGQCGKQQVASGGYSP